MKKPTSGLVLVGVFLLGCVTSQVTESVVSPPTVQAQPQNTAGVQKWRYECIGSMDRKVLVKWANQAGAQGWEMVGGAAGVGQGTWGPKDKSLWCFKQPVR